MKFECNESDLRIAGESGKPNCQSHFLSPIRQNQSGQVEIVVIKWVNTKGRNPKYGRSRTSERYCIEHEMCVVFSVQHSFQTYLAS
jgi:hypothetical protein